MTNNIKGLENNAKYKNARGALLALVLFSTINLFSIIFGEVYFLFSSYITQIIAYVGYTYYYETQEMVFVAVAIVLGIISVLPYIISYIFSKKKPGWMIVALVFFSIDTLLFMIDFIGMIMAGEVGMIMDLVFHIYALGSLIYAVVYGIKAKKTILEEDIIDDTVPSVLVNTEAEDYSESLSKEVRKLTISKKKEFYGYAVSCICCVDGQNVATLKNGKSVELSIDGNSHTLVVIVSTGTTSEPVTIPSGYGDKKYEIKFKAGFVKGAIPIITEQNDIGVNI